MCEKVSNRKLNSFSWLLCLAALFFANAISPVHAASTFFTAKDKSLTALNAPAKLTAIEESNTGRTGGGKAPSPPKGSFLADLPRSFTLCPLIISLSEREVADSSYKGMKAEILSARPHPPTL